MISVLHITPHLGGGVGRVLSQLASYRTQHMPQMTQCFVCLEAPKKTQALAQMRESGIEVFVAPDAAQMSRLVSEADIVQVEWWHHPLMLQFLCSMRTPARLIFWAHNSGLTFPIFPHALLENADTFVATTAATCTRYAAANMAVVPSSGGLDDVPPRSRRHDAKTLRFGYLGSLNSAKLHPEIGAFLDAVETPGFMLEVYGDAVPNSPLNAAGARTRLHGFTPTPFEAMATLDVLVYLLNPSHYGTTENALLEAMAAGVVPIVLDNPVERAIVQHGVTGLVVETPESFAQAVAQLHDNRDMLARMSAAASADIRARFSLAATAQGLQQCYEQSMHKPKRTHDFSAVFGATPGAWFEAALGDAAPVLRCDTKARHAAHYLYESSKSSPYHFARYFPTDATLQQWCTLLRSDTI